MSDAQLHQIDLVGNTVEYEVSHSADATEPRIDVDIHGVTVVIPEGERARPSELLKENAAWVIEKRRKYETYREQVPEREFEPGATFPYLGDPHTVVVERRPASSVGNGTLRLAEYHVAETSVKRALETLYRRSARQTFERQADHYADQMDVKYEQIEVRNQRTKWGSCSTTGTLGLNWRLMMAPIGIINYIIIHELAHLQEPNHTDSFWSLVSEYDPEYDVHARWLNENSVELIFSKGDL